MGSFTELLFDTPWWVLAALAAVGLALLYAGNNRQDKTLLRLGVGVLVGGVAVFVVSWIVETDREQVERGTAEMVRAVDRKDWTAFGNLLDDQAKLVAGVTVYNNRQQFVRGASQTADAIGLKVVRMMGREVSRRGENVFDAAVTAYSEQDRFPYPQTTGWQVKWVRRNGAWKIEEIAATGSGTGAVTPDRVRSQLANPQ
jgi:uncharacterized membrane protein YeiB